MAVVVIRRIEVFDEKLYHGNGDVAKWCRKITGRFAREARRYAPVRTGRLRASIRASTGNPGPKQCSGRIGLISPYGLYVLRGTGYPVRGIWGDIYSTKGFAQMNRGKKISKKNGMAVGKQSLYPPIKVMGVVSGQRANDFLKKAWVATGFDHTSIRGKPFPIEY
jgi:hypothetical protein